MFRQGRQFFLFAAKRFLANQNRAVAQFAVMDLILFYPAV